MFDGPPVNYSSLSKVLAVGVLSDDLTVESNTVTAGLRAQREQADLTCSARVWSGDPDDNALSRCRTAAFAAEAAVRKLLAADSTAGGSVKRARLVDVRYTATRDDAGVAAYVDLGIRIDDI